MIPGAQTLQDYGMDNYESQAIHMEKIATTTTNPKKAVMSLQRKSNVTISM